MYDRVVETARRLDWPVFTLELLRAKRSEKSFFYASVAAVALTLIGIPLMIIGSITVDGAMTLDVSVFFIILLSTLRFAYVFLLVPLHSSKTIVTEREAKRFDNLALTGLSSWEIAFQKAALPVAYALVIAVITLPLDFLHAWRGGSLSWLGMVGPVYFLLQVVFYTGIGVLCSSLCVEARTAAIITYAALLLTPGLNTTLWAGFSIALVPGWGMSQRELTSSSVIGGMLAGTFWLLVGMGGALFCLLLASRKLESLRSCE